MKIIMENHIRLPSLCFLFVDSSDESIYVGLLSSYRALKLIDSSCCGGYSPSRFCDALRDLGTSCRGNGDSFLKEADFFFQLRNGLVQGFYFLILSSFFLK